MNEATSIDYPTDYATRSGAELIDLLFQHEDRVTLEHIQAVIARGEETLPRLREIYQNEDYWYEGKGGDHFIVLHALVALALNRQPEDGALIFRQLMDAFYADHEWAMEYLPAALAEFGAEMIDPLMDFIVKERGAEWENAAYGQARHKCVVALARIAHALPSERERIFQFFAALFEAKEENRFFLSHAADGLVFFDRKRGLPIVKTAMMRGQLSKEMTGSYQEYVRSWDASGSTRSFDFDSELLDFYDPEMIAARQERWRDEAANPDQLYWEPGQPPPRNAPARWQLEQTDVALPTGYEVAESGSVLRGEKVGRNDPCPCGSGKKYKKCHGS